MEKHESHENMKIDEIHYQHLLIMAVLSFISMYLLMYSMVNTVEQFKSMTNPLL